MTSNSTMPSTHRGQHFLFIYYQELVLSVIEYALEILQLSKGPIDRLEKIQTEVMRIILEIFKVVESVINDKSVSLNCNFPAAAINDG